VMGGTKEEMEQYVSLGAQETPAELTASEYLKMHVYPTLEPVRAAP